MFWCARIRAPQCGQAERGVRRLYFAGGADAARSACCMGAAAPDSASSSSACVRHCRSSMAGSRWITTFRKLPTSSESRKAPPRSSAGVVASASSTLR